MNIKELRQIFLLLLAAMIWGGGFVAQSIGAENVEAFTFLASRNVLGTLALTPLLILRKTKIDAATIKAGVIMGCWLCAASFAQQLGISYTTTAKAGFITTMYIIFVPFASLLLFKKKLDSRIWLCVALSVAGLALLNHMSFALSFGDALILLCALFYTGHILTIDHFAECDGIATSCIQFLTTAILSGIGAMIFETPTITAIGKAAPAILYTGLFSTGVAYTLQVIGQKGVNPSLASICLSMESAFAALFGFLILKQILGVGELIGCILMFASVIISQLPLKKSSS